MKKYIFILVFIIFICTLILYPSSEKKLLKNFADDTINDNVSIEKIIEKYIVCDEKAILMTTIQLEFVRAEYKKHPSEICIYSYEEAKKEGKEIKGIVCDNYDKVYFIYFNDKLYLTLLLNKNSKIIAISTLNKGGARFFMKTDGGK